MGGQEVAIRSLNLDKTIDQIFASYYTRPRTLHKVWVAGWWWVVGKVILVFSFSLDLAE